MNKRQTDIINKGKIILSDTRLWNDKEEKTYSMRSKELPMIIDIFPSLTLSL